MTKQDNEMYLINIENLAASIISQLGSDVVASVFSHFGAHGTWDLDPCYLQDVFNELHDIDADLK